MTGQEINQKLRERNLTIRWLVEQLANYGYSISYDSLRQLLTTGSGTRSKGVIDAASDILLTYDRAFRRPNIKVGDMVEGESQYGEYLSGKVVSTTPKVIIETYSGFRVPCFKIRQYTPTGT